LAAAAQQSMLPKCCRPYPISTISKRHVYSTHQPAVSIRSGTLHAPRQSDNTLARQNTAITIQMDKHDRNDAHALADQTTSSEHLQHSTTATVNIHFIVPWRASWTGDYTVSQKKQDT